MSEYKDSEYSFYVASSDMSVALDCEADRAQREGFKGVEARQRASALHLRNAVRHMESVCPTGYRVETLITVKHVPDINPVLRDEYREHRYTKEVNTGHNG